MAFSHTLALRVLAVAAVGILPSQPVAAQTAESGERPLTSRITDARWDRSPGVGQPAPGAQSARPQDPTERTESPGEPFWTKRKIALIGGTGASLTAGAIAVVRERDLRYVKRQMEGLPPGATDEWNRRLADANGLLNARNFWGAVAIGVGSVTAVYALTSGSPDLSVVRRMPASASAGKPTWDLRLNLVMPGVSVAWSF
jgi:hypothetical protein